jgi:serine/threonine-protein kinase
VGLLGVGGMGSVYRVHDLLLDEEVALKILRKDLSESPPSLARFRREVKLARHITHPNVARIYDIGESDGEHFYTMECILGDSLSGILGPEPLTLSRSLDIICQVAQALAASHKAGVIHRDLKPDNVLVSRDGRIVLTDFGVAITVHDSAEKLENCGTPKYMAPEQLDARPLSEKTDLYALGLLAFELLTGKGPWDGLSAEASRAARLAAVAPALQTFDPSIPKALSDLVAKLLEPRPEDRPSSAHEVARVLNELESSVIAESALKEMPNRPSTLPEIATTATPRARSIAIVPFKNEGEPLDGVIAETLTEELTGHLAASPHIRIASRGRPKEWEDSREFGRRAKADVVVAGSVQRESSSEFCVHIRLTEVQHGFVLWAADYRCPDAEVFQLIPEIAGEVADAMTVELRWHRSANARHIDNVETFLLARRAYGEWIVESTSSSISQIRGCLAQNPLDSSLTAYLSLAILRLQQLDPEAPSSLSVEAQALACRALDLEPNLSEAHLAMAICALFEASWVTAARRTEEAVRCNPALAGAHHVLGYLRACTGDVEQGLRMLDVSLRLDPKYLASAWDAAYASAIVGDHDRSLNYLTHADSVFPNHPRTVIARLRIASWMADHQRLVQAREAASRCNVPAQSLDETVLHLFLEAEPDRQIGALTAIAAAKNAPAVVRYRLMQLVAERALLSGLVDEAWSAVRSVAPDTIDWLWFSRCPSLDRLRRDTQFITILASIQSKAAQVFEPSCSGFLRS